ncbi:hypothetical protein DXZ20_04815 [Leptolyngbyaceae cyanobacterium CCMR0081]|uniref:Uncharacterized protein n=1 Tax=Adonisia turfae CCMR0081 TaxID=2292702 RepID=A0A6M0RFK6_9CYAN|nr:hypothetical protein [Adonisia turfae CCMR0081]
MCLHIIILNKDQETYRIWTDAFSRLSKISVVNSNSTFSQYFPTLDAVLMLGISAHERYGGGPRPNESQILDTQRLDGMSPWVVTVPSTFTFLESATTPNNVLHTQISHGKIEDRYYLIFKKIFESIEKFNSSQEITKIKSLGVDLAYIKVTSSHALEKIRGFKNAYNDVYLHS